MDYFLVYLATRMDFLYELLVHDTTSNLVVPVYLWFQDPSSQRHSYLLVIRPIIQLVDGKANTRVIIVFLHLDDLLHAHQLLRVGQRTGESFPWRLPGPTEDVHMHSGVSVHSNVLSQYKGPDCSSIPLNGDMHSAGSAFLCRKRETGISRLWSEVNGALQFALSFLPPAVSSWN